MAKKKIFNCVFLEVAIEKPGWGVLSKEHWYGAARDVVSQIKRHCDGVSTINIQPDIDVVCEFCGWDWTEYDSNLYNGGCCDKDKRANEERSVPPIKRCETCGQLTQTEAS